MGEIWIDSPSKAQGYWNQPEISIDAFQAKILSSNTNANTNITSSSSNASNNNRTYLRTGDMGFLYKKELFICGRIKDLIIIRGSNHYPQDIERTAEKSTQLIRQGCSAAFALTHEATHTEIVVFVVEV